jgi:PKD repeat protein
VIEPPPLPFPVTLVTVPKSLIGPAPFSLLAHIETPEQVSEVNWSFGDEEGESGKDLVKIGHSYERPGIYPLTAKVRIQSGSAAILSTIVRVTDALQIHDLSFESPEGLPKVEAGNVIKGEAPLTLQIRPRTALPLIEFSWEAPEESNPSFEGGELKAVFRDTGNYTVVLFAKNAEGRSMRLPITVEVAPPPIEPSVEIRKDSETAPMTVTFDASDSYIPPGERIAGFKWLFGDEKDRNELPELGRPRVTHVYENPGTYQLTLSVVLESGREYSVVRTIVVPKPDLRACFVRSRATITTGSPVRFDGSCSAGKVTTALWEIRSVSSPEKVLAQSPTFPMYTATFDAPGRYTVKLLVRDQWEAEDQESVTLDVESPLPETP